MTDITFEMVKFSSNINDFFIKRQIDISLYSIEILTYQDLEKQKKILPGLRLSKATPKYNNSIQRER